MGFIEGESLAHKVADGPLPPREAAELVKKICDAMAYAHERGVIHRDLKPANILIDQNGQPKVTDFGLAKKNEADSDLTGTGQILGTPGYMPPEQASGKTDVGPLADVYSLGAILYCLLTGRPPFQAANPMDTLLQVLDKEPIAPRQLNASVPVDLETICLKCLRKQANKRYETPTEIAEELTRHLKGEPILARPIGRMERSWRWCLRKPVTASLSASLLIVFLTGLVTANVLWLRAESARRGTEAAQKTAQANLCESLLREADLLRSVRRSGYKAEAWQRLEQAVQIDGVDVDYARVRQSAVACLGDFVGLTPLTLQESQSRPLTAEQHFWTTTRLP